MTALNRVLKSLGHNPIIHAGDGRARANLVKVWKKTWPQVAVAFFIKSGSRIRIA